MRRGCESTCSITVTTTPPPVCTIIGSTSFCEGEPSKLCGPEDAYSYLWSTGETTECIDVTVAGTYTLTVTNEEGCESTCSITVTTTPPPVCTIIGSTSFCLGEPSKLCGPEDAYSYLWSTGETTECIDVTVAGTYTLTVTNEEGCRSTCSITVTITPPPVCTVIGSTSFCPASRASSAGRRTPTATCGARARPPRCIDVTVAGPTP
ncbi:MAG: hypothetical protein IPM46_12850 [Flavobacteriales bacterium]|nr:hypothetical protein [Flavobacteriales bacterium]